MSLPYQLNLIPQAKELRKNATKEENHLWYDLLRQYLIRFQRQKTIGGLQGIQVLRFSNRDIHPRFWEVCDAIYQEVQKRLKGSGTV